MCLCRVLVENPAFVISYSPTLVKPEVCFIESWDLFSWGRTVESMESTMVSTKRELQESLMVSTEQDKDAEIRHPSINTEPRTLDETKMERAMVTAQKLYAEHPSEDFTKDAVDTATRENAPAEDAGDANSLETHPEDVVQKPGNAVDTPLTQSKTSMPTEDPAAPLPTPAT